MANPTRKPPPSRSRMLERLDYDSDTGIFTWKRRVGADTATRSWNSKHAGKAAGSIVAKGYMSIKMDGVYYQAHRLA